MFYINYDWLSPLDLLRFIILRSLEHQRRFRETYNFLLSIMRIILIVVLVYFMIYILCLLFVVMVYSCLIYLIPRAESECGSTLEDEKEEEQENQQENEIENEEEDENEDQVEGQQYQIAIHLVVNEDAIAEEPIIPLPVAQSPPRSENGDALFDDEIETPIDRNEQGDSEYQIGELVMGDHEPQEYGDHSVDAFDLDEDPFDGWD